MSETTAIDGLPVFRVGYPAFNGAVRFTHVFTSRPAAMRWIKANAMRQAHAADMRISEYRAACRIYETTPDWTDVTEQ